MTKRLIEAAQAAVDSYCGLEVGLHTRIEQLQAALDEARQPVTVTEEQAIDLVLTFHRAADGDEPTQAEVDALSTEGKQEIAAVMTAVLLRAKELGL